MQEARTPPILRKTLDRFAVTYAKLLTSVMVRDEFLSSTPTPKAKKAGLPSNLDIRKSAPEIDQFGAVASGVNQRRENERQKQNDTHEAPHWIHTGVHYT